MIQEGAEARPGHHGANGAASAAAWDGLGAEPGSDPPDYLAAWDAPAGTDGEDDRPIVKIKVGEVPRMVREAIRALGQRDENMYQRAGELVRIVREPDRREAYEADEYGPRDIRRGHDILTRPGTPRLRPLTTSLLYERCALAARWQSFDGRRGKGKAGERGGEWVEADPCGRTVNIIAGRGDWPGIRPAKGILETPCFTPSERIIVDPGYDDETKYIMLPTCNVGGPIAERPTKEQAGAALRYLWTEIACDFPFVGVGEPDHEKDPDRALQYAKALDAPDAFVGIAMLLTLFARPAILGACPGGLFEAAGMGAGKSKQIHTIAMVATSRPAGVMTFPMRDGRPNEEELEKVLAGYALANARVVAFDNIRGLLGGAGLEKVLTAEDSIDLRVLGASDVRTLPWSAVSMYSGNNLTMTDDVAQRVLRSRLESPREDPRSRPANTFRHPELMAAIKSMRGRLVRAAIVVLRAFFAARKAGETMQDPGTWGSFEAWSRIIPGAIMWAGGPNVLKARPELGRGGDEEGEAHAILMRMWRDDWQGIKGSALVERLYKLERDIAHGKEPPDGLDDVRSAVRTLTKTKDGQVPGAHALGMRLGHLRGRIRDGRRIVRGIDGKTSVATWSVESV